jgi:hypothetical protein
MSDLDKFLEALQTDEELRAQLPGLTTREAWTQFSLHYLEQKGWKLQKEDLWNLWDELTDATMGSLSDKQLDSVVGGATYDAVTSEKLGAVKKSFGDWKIGVPIPGCCTQGCCDEKSLR